MTAITARCPGCHLATTFPAEWVGMSVRCECGTVFSVARADAEAQEPPPCTSVDRPGAADALTLCASCPRCGETGPIPADRRGWEAMCTWCRKRFVLTDRVLSPRRPGRFRSAVRWLGREVNRDISYAFRGVARWWKRRTSGAGTSGFLLRRAGGSVPSWADGSVILDDYVVERKLGQGGMGAVYLVRNWADDGLFAVKRALVQADEERRQFLKELITWQDLPEHPLLAPFRFFRSVGDEIVIFTDFVEGGSLADWVTSGRLTRLEDLLDVAIQFAEGLHVAHEAGFVHRDVKPHNALMTADGKLKVTDFGLARCRYAAGQTAGNESIVVSSGGMTPAYASPEQAAGRALSRRTDIWSWAVSVLDLFVGRVPSCRSGPIAPRILEGYLASGPMNAELPPMPLSLADVLRRCLRPDPADRPPDLAGVAVALRSLHQELTGRVYSRQLALPRRDTRGVARHGPREVDRGRWADPRDMLVKALQADARDPSEADSLVPPPALSRGSQVTADLAVLEAAQSIYRRLVAAGRDDLLPQAAELALTKGVVHWAADDLPGAVGAYDEAIGIYRRLVWHGGRPDLAAELAHALRGKGVVLRAAGDRQGSAGACDEAIGIYRWLVEHGGRPDLAGKLAHAVRLKGHALCSPEDSGPAVRAYDEAIGFYRRLAEQGTDVAAELADTLADKGYAIQKWAKGQSINDWDERGGTERRQRWYDEIQRAVGAYDEAIEIYRQLVEHRGRSDLEAALLRVRALKESALSEREKPAQQNRRGFIALMILLAVYIVLKSGLLEGRSPNTPVPVVHGPASPAPLPSAAPPPDRMKYDPLQRWRDPRDIGTWGAKAPVPEVGEGPARTDFWGKFLAEQRRRELGGDTKAGPGGGAADGKVPRVTWP